MTDRIIPFGSNPSDTATLLLAAAEELGVGQEVVRTVEGGFRVPEEVAAKADEQPEIEREPEPGVGPEESPKVEPDQKESPKKQAAKRSPKK